MSLSEANVCSRLGIAEQKKKKKKMGKDKQKIELSKQSAHSPFLDTSYSSHTATWSRCTRHTRPPGLWLKQWGRTALNRCKSSLSSDTCSSRSHTDSLAVEVMSHDKRHQQKNNNPNWVAFLVREQYLAVSLTTSGSCGWVGSRGCRVLERQTKHTTSTCDQPF